MKKDGLAAAEQDRFTDTIGAPPSPKERTFSMGTKDADASSSPAPTSKAPMDHDEEASAIAGDSDYVVPVLHGDEQEAVEGYLEFGSEDEETTEHDGVPLLEGFMRIGGKWISVKLDQFSMEGIRFIVKGQAPKLEVVLLALREKGPEKESEQNPVIHCKALVQEQRKAQGSGEVKTVVSADYFEFMCEKGRKPLKDFLFRILRMERVPTTGFRTEHQGTFFDFDRAIRKRNTPLLARSKIIQKHLKEAEAEDLEKRRRLNAINDKRE